MPLVQSADPTPRKPLRLWPGVAAAALLVSARVVALFLPDTMMFAILGGIVLALVVLLWWLLFSRAPWSERLGAVALMVLALAATPRILHASIAGGMMGMMFFIHAIPWLSVAFVAWAVATRRLGDFPRRASMVATILLACGAWALLRTGGLTGAGASDFHWRWVATPEERLLAEAGDEPEAPPLAPAAAGVREERSRADQPEAHPPAAPATDLPTEPATAKAGDEPGPPIATPAPRAAAPVTTEADWPGFRGPARDSVIRGVRIETDWSNSPPAELWRRPIGPGWSSVAVQGDVLYTQEQRGDHEVVAAYKVTTGEPIWRHRDAVRFWESNGGAGPRATPAIRRGRVFTLGATGIVNALDAATGAVVWSRNAASDTGAKLPGWGFAGSPLVVGDLVVVAASGKLVAYDLATGHARWSAQTTGGSYSSPHLATIHGVPQILLLSGTGATSVAPADGTTLWEHPWPGVPIVQPAVTADGDILISTADMSGGIGMRRLAVVHRSDGWRVEERWTSRGLKPYFNDYVVNDGHAFGFDGSILSCINLEDGTRKWKGGRYGQGQLVLLPDQDLLLILSEDGELALVGATTNQFTEVARFPALNSKTWNHPVLVRDILLVRNGEEMAAFRLSLAGR
jgi:hypothetical protein